MRDDRFQIKEEQTLDLGNVDLQKADCSRSKPSPGDRGADIWEGTF
jgi:hypothetical protein